MSSVISRLKNRGYRAVIIFFLAGGVSLLPAMQSFGESNRLKHMEDQILNSETGLYGPFYSDGKRRTDFVSGCGEIPVFQKNVEQFRFIEAAMMGKDDRCLLRYGQDADEKDKALYGVGQFYDAGGKCASIEGNKCSGAGHLVLDQDMVITSSHLFLDERSNKYTDGEGFQFWIKVWIPVALRENPQVAYEFRPYEVEKVEIHRKSKWDPKSKDFAFVKLKEKVGERVGRKLGKNKYGKKKEVDKSQLVKPLPFKILGDDRFQKDALMAAFHIDKDNGNVAYKNCVPFGIRQDPDFEGQLNHDGDMVDLSSGAAIAIPDERGILTFAGVNVTDMMLPGQTQFDNLPYDYPNRYNIAVDGNAIYSEFMRFRRQFGRSSTVPEWMNNGQIGI
ncbi:MAG: hypothetical protein KDD35_08530 [Bdellovibrionales bacterium]|nr:hypothetical protein [Bdellovibrionales bacterium]